MDLTLDMTGLQAVETLSGMSGCSSSLSTDAKNYRNNSPIYASMNQEKIIFNLTANTSGLVHEKHSGSGWFTYTTYDWTGNNVQAYRINISADDNPRIEGRMKQLYEKIAEIIKNKAKVVKTGKNAIVADAGKNQIYYALCAGRTVAVFFGRLDVETCDVKSYGKVSEDESIQIDDPLLSSASSMVDNSQIGDEEDSVEL